MVYVVSDLHGDLNGFMRLTQEIKLNNSDMMFVLGDVIDRGSDSIPLLFDMMSRPNVFPLLGDHEFEFSECAGKLPLDASMDDFMTGLDESAMERFTSWIQNGGQQTFEQYMDLSPEERESILEYLEEFTLHEALTVNKRDFILTHSGLGSFNRDTPVSEYQLFDYLYDSPTLDDTFFDDKLLVFGHTPTFEYGESYTGLIVKRPTFISIDCGNAYKDKGGRLGCLRLDDLKEFYI